MDANKHFVKYFKRILKEIGLYRVWLIERCNMIQKERHNEKIFDVITERASLADIIDNSFW